jgi:nucleoside-diphosphate-sugar epimerase
MKVLFIGGTGIISTACTALAIERGYDLFLLNRGQKKADIPASVKSIHADIRNLDQTRAALRGQTFDVVVNWIAFTQEHVETDIDLFSKKTGQYVFISSASAYQKPVSHYLITESTPLANPFWEYSRNKIACEDRLMREYRENNFPAMIVRPSHTYGETIIPHGVGSWLHPWTIADRMLKNQPILVHGDGFCERFRWIARQPANDRACVSYHQRRSLKLEPNHARNRHITGCRAEAGSCFERRNHPTSAGGIGLIDRR